jgi:Tfp pilus assembly protein PilV
MKRADFNRALTHHQKIRSAAFSAFTLLEVMIACGVFFMAMFAILALVSNLLRNAQYLRHVEVDAGIVAAQLYKTNKLSEGIDSGDFGDAYKGYSWKTDSREAATNGLWQVDILVTKQGQSEPVDKMSVWVFSPESSSLPFNNKPR